MTNAQPAIDPKVEIWADMRHVYFDMTVVKPDDQNAANEWRLHFNSNNFKSRIRDAVLAVLDEVQAGTFEKRHHVEI